MSPEQLRVVILVMGLMVAFGSPVVQCPKTTIEGEDGETVILSCSTKNKMDLSLEQVEWLFEDPTTRKNKTVHTYSQREDYLDDQTVDFRNRTSLFNESFYLGNCSLSLKVNTALSGRYYCCVVTDGKPHCCPVDLKVHPKGVNDPIQDPDNPNNGTDGLTMPVKIVIGGVVVVAAAVLGVIIWVVRRKRHKHQNEPVDPNEQIQLKEIVGQGAPADGNEPATGS